MRLTEIPALLKYCINLHLPLLMIGSPGCGKSDVVEAIAVDLGFDLIIDHPSVADPVDVKGVPMAAGDRAVWLPLGNLSRLIHAKKDTICFLDDLGQANPSVQAAYMQLLLARRLGDHQISDKVHFVAATNRVTDNSGAYAILEAVKGRFGTIVEIEPNSKDWIDWALLKKIPHEFVSYARFRPNLFSDWKPGKGLANTCTPRTFTNAARLWEAGCQNKEVLCGAIGEGTAIEVLAHLALIKALPEIEHLLNNPKKAQIPKEPSILYALCGAISSYADRNWQGIVQYAERLPIEFAYILISDCLMLYPTLKHSPEFKNWAVAHKEMLL